MENEFVAVSPDEPLRFSCGPKVPCFNECCRDLNQFLAPYDIVRLKSRLGLSSGEFLRRYTVEHTGPESGLPVVRFRQNPGEDLRCPFVTPQGCSVYEDRPSSCRIYPVARAISRNRETGEIAEHFMLLKERHCRGFECGGEQTVRQWLRNQGLEIYNETNDLLMEIVAWKNAAQPGPLDLKSSRLFHMACYDVDSFREKVFETGELDDSFLDAGLLQLAKTDDAALLRIGLHWLKARLSERMSG